MGEVSLQKRFLEVANKVSEINKTETEGKTGKQKTTTGDGSGEKYAIVTLDNGMSYVQASRNVITGKTVKEIKQEPCS